MHPKESQILIRKHKKPSYKTKNNSYKQKYIVQNQGLFLQNVKFLLLPSIHFHSYIMTRFDHLKCLELETYEVGIYQDSNNCVQVKFTLDST